MRNKEDEIITRNNDCDEECSAVNGCKGHAACVICGRVFCGCELDNAGWCGSCVADYGDKDYA